MAWPNPTPESISRAQTGDRDAINQVLNMYRKQLKSVAANRLDGRLAARIDESDVVQDVLIAAHGLIPAWLSDGKAVYACLYRLVLDRLAELRRTHIEAQMRSVKYEEPRPLALSGDSVRSLCHQLVSRVSTPSRAALRREETAKVRNALEALSDNDREVLVMRILESTPAKEVALALGISEAAVHKRHLRALQRLRSVLELKQD